MTEQLLKLFKKPVHHWLFLLLILMLVACESDKQFSSVSQSNKVRIITLSPHLAELVDSAGALDNLVGVVAYSDFPEKVKSIDLVGDAFKLDYEKVISLQPDYILTWKGGTPQAVIEKLHSLNFNIIETQINTLSDIPNTIAQIANLIDPSKTNEMANININHFNKSLNQLKQQTREHKTVFIETYHQPLYTVSGKHWMSEAALICGYQNIFSDLSQLSVPVTLESVITKNPQAILNIAQQEDSQWQAWRNLTAVKNKQIITIHPDYFSRPSMRILKGIKQLCDHN